MAVASSDDDLGFWKDVAAFARTEVLPHILEWDRDGRFPSSLWRRLGEKGLLGLAIPKEFGGLGAGVSRLALALDAFAYGSKDLGIVNSWGVHSAMVAMAVQNAGTPEQKRRYLPGLASGALTGAFALTEPDAGSNASAIKTSAIPNHDGYSLSGQKCFVTNGPIADLFLIIARTRQSDDAFTAFLVERGTAGLSVGSAEDKSCIRTSPCCDLELAACAVAADQRLGVEGHAFETIVLPVLDWDRCIVWAGRIGRLRSLVEDSTAYAKNRVQFGRPIWRHQAIMFKIAEMKVRLNAAEALLARAINRLAKHGEARLEAAVARSYIGDATIRSAEDAAQIFGGYAFYPRNHVERYHRDARLDGIGGGTAEIQRLIIGRITIDAVDEAHPWMSMCIMPEAGAVS